MENSEKIKQLVSAEFMEEMTGIRRHLHSHPELSFREEETSRYVRELLDRWKISYRYPVAGTGIVATVKGSGPGPRIAVRADMDALPIMEESGVDFISENPGVMHACGHDVHMTCLLGAIRLVDRMKDQMNGELMFIFQPGEEKIPGGASLMLEDGVFRYGLPDVIIAQHVLPDMDAGRVGFREGNYMASSDEIYITVNGKGGHGALPQGINDPVLMASHILITLHQEIRRKSPSGIPTVISFGKVVADGAVNVIPDRVFLEGTFRTMNEPWRKEAHDLIRQVASGIAQGMGGTCEVEVRKGYPVLRNDPPLTGRCRKLAAEFLGEHQVEDMDIRMTAEDFAWFAQTIPGMMYRLGVRTPGSAEVYPLHTPGFRIDESALETGIGLMAFLSLELLKTTGGE